MIVILLPASIAFIVSSIWGLVLLTILSYLIARIKNASPAREIILHLAIALIVIAGSKSLGDFLTKLFAG